MAIEDIAARFMRLFAGFDQAYYTSDVTGQTNAQGKATAKYKTVRERLTVDVWMKHLEGEQGLLIIPIDKDNKCRWGCIDVDDYSIDLVALAKRLQSMRLPLVLCRTKSGGGHIFVFLKEPVSANVLQGWIREVAAGLGLSKCEIFPKQTEVLLDRGDLGNGLNMPYFGGDKTPRHAIKPDGGAASMLEFLDAVEGCLVHPSTLTSLGIKKEDELLKGGPPCLQTLAANGFPDGTRNNGLMALGTFCKKAHPDRWKEQLEEMNRKFMQPPLPSDEVAGVIKQLERKDYNYRCPDHPLVQFCNSGVCRTRKFGVGASGAMPLITSLTKLNTDPPLWFLDVEGGRLELQTEDLLIQGRFQKKCMEILNVVPPKMQEAQWQNLLQGLLDKVQVIEAPADAGTKGAFFDLLESFCTDRARGKNREDLLRGLPLDEEGRTYFRLKDLMAYLQRHHFKDYGQQQVLARLRDLNAIHGFWKVKGRGVNWYSIPQFDTMDEGYDGIKVNGSPM